MIEFRKALEVVLDHYGVDEAELFSSSQKSEVVVPRKMMVYLMGHLSNSQIAKLIHRSKEVVRLYRTDMHYSIDKNESVRENYQMILQKIQNQVTIKLNKPMVKALWEILEDFLSMKPDSIALELVCLLLDDLKEKVRKRARAEKENIQLDEKQLRAFLIWYHHFSTIYEKRHPYGYLTLLEIINQIKPIANAQRIDIQT